MTRRAETEQQEWDGSFTPEQQAFHDEVERNTASLMSRLGVTEDELTDDAGAES